MDIFKIKAANVAFSIGDKEYPFVDPPFLAKINVRQRFMALRANAEAGKLDPIEYSKEMFAVNKKHVMLFLPTLDEALLNTMGDASMQTLMRKLTELSESEFGAVLEKVSEK